MHFKWRLSRILKSGTNAKTERTAATTSGRVRRYIGEGMPTSANICDNIRDTCSRINIESLSSPDGYSHVSKKLASKSCPLCKEIFSGMKKNQEDVPVRIKLSRDLTSMESVIWYLSAELETWGIRWSIRCGLPVITQEGQIFAALHNKSLAKFSAGDPATVRYGIPTSRAVTSSGSQPTFSIANGWLKHCVDNHDCQKSLFLPQGKENQHAKLSNIIKKGPFIQLVFLIYKPSTKTVQIYD